MCACKQVELADTKVNAHGRLSGQCMADGSDLSIKAVDQACCFGQAGRPGWLTRLVTGVVYQPGCQGHSWVTSKSGISSNNRLCTYAHPYLRNMLSIICPELRSRALQARCCIALQSCVGAIKTAHSASEKVVPEQSSSRYCITPSCRSGCCLEIRRRDSTM